MEVAVCAIRHELLHIALPIQANVLQPSCFVKLKSMNNLLQDF